jgi:hypothetical protein
VISEVLVAERQSAPAAGGSERTGLSFQVDDVVKTAVKWWLAAS